MDMKQALQELGVRTDILSDEAKANFDRDGYVVIPDVLPRAIADQMAASMEAIAAAEGEAAGRDFQVEPGTTRLGSLINKDPIFDTTFLHPLALALVAHRMGDDFGLSSITARAALPGEGHQAFHWDSHAPAINILWVVSDFTAANGPTRVVPGSHRFGEPPYEGMADPAAHHPDETYVIAPAGTLVAIHGHTWHSGTRNNTARNRHLVSAFWTPRGGYQQEANRVLTPEAQARLAPAAQFVVDHETA